MKRQLIDVNAKFELKLLDACLDSMVGNESIWRRDLEAHIPERIKARELLRQYVLLLWEKRGRDQNLTCGDIIENSTAYFDGAMGALVGEVQVW
jgi:hypothetical protein